MCMLVCNRVPEKEDETSERRLRRSFTTYNLLLASYYLQLTIFTTGYRRRRMKRRTAPVRSRVRWFNKLPLCACMHGMYAYVCLYVCMYVYLCVCVCACVCVCVCVCDVCSTYVCA